MGRDSGVRGASRRDGSAVVTFGVVALAWAGVGYGALWLLRAHPDVFWCVVAGLVVIASGYSVVQRRADDREEERRADARRFARTQGRLVETRQSSRPAAGDAADAGQPN
jgi:O-antigen ligase